MNVAIIGTRGIPNNYGGFEQLAEILSVRLVKLGCSVTVYNSEHHPYKQSNFNGVTLIKCADPENWMGTVGQFFYDFNCIVNTRKHNFDVILQLGYTSSSIWYWLFKRKATVITNMDGLEWKRSKYGKFTKIFLKFAEKLAVKHSHCLVADSTGIQDYVRETYKKNSHFIAYGSEIQNSYEEETLTEFGILKNNYFLIIARLESENNIETILNGYLLSKSNLPILVIGGLTTKHALYLKQKFYSPQIIFIGPLYNQTKLNDLRYFSKLYFHGHSVGGTNPSLIEAMAAQAPICAYNCVFNRSVLNNEATYFNSPKDIAEKITNSFSEYQETNKQINLQKVKDIYNWEKITTAYYQLITNHVN